MSEEVRAENCSDFSHIVQSCGRIVHEFYGTIYANKENGKLESNKRMWLYEKIHISILGNRVSVTYSKPANKKSSVFLKKISKIRFDILCITFKPPEMPALKVVI